MSEEMVEVPIIRVLDKNRYENCQNLYLKILKKCTQRDIELIMIGDIEPKI